MNRYPAIILLVLPVLFVGGCGDDEEITLFSRSQAEKFVYRWAKLVRDGKLDDAAKDMVAPFRYRTRTWHQPDEIRRNVESQLPGLREGLERTLAIECFTYGDLSEGRWPRGKALDFETLGVQVDGFYMWLKRGKNSTLPGMTLVVNPSADGERLVLQGIDPQ